MDYQHAEAGHSQTAVVMERLELIGGHKPEFGLDEPDHRPTPDEDTVGDAVGDILDILHSLSEKTKLEDDIENLVSSIATSFHYMYRRAERKLENTQMEVRRLDRENDGSEIKDSQMQQQVNLMVDLNERLEMLENLRDQTAEQIKARFGKVWHPPAGTHASRYTSLTHTVVEAREVLKAQTSLKLESLIPEGPRVGFAGGKEFDGKDALHRIYHILDVAKRRHPDMVLVHGGAKKGAERIAQSWADNKGVKVIVCTPDWNTHNKAAPFIRNDEMLKLDLVGLIATPGSGITENLVDKARKKGVPVKLIS